MCACSADHGVAVEPPRPGADAARACAALHALLPSTVGGAKRREVSPAGNALTAAWGRPAIILRCGVGEPPIDLSGEHDDVAVDGVDWRPVQDSAGYTFTTVGRVASVDVRVPKAYAPEVNPLLDLAKAVDRALPMKSPP